MAVLGGSLHRVHHDLGEVGIARQGHSPLDVVVETTGTGQVCQDGLVAVAVHESLGRCAGQGAQLVRAANLAHRVTGRDRETRLVDAQPVLAERHTNATAFGILAAHDGLTANRVQQIELDLVAHFLTQVHGTDDGVVRAGLLAQRALCFSLGGHLARQAVHGRVTGHVRGEQASGLNNFGHRMAVRNTRLATHDGLLQWEGATPSRRCLALSKTGL